MKIKFFFVIVLVLIFSFSMAGQSDVSEPAVYPGGLSLQYGLGSYAVKDNYISPERYTGTLPYYRIGWTRTHNRYVYKLNFTYRESDNIRNNNVTTRIIQFKLSQGFLYPLKPISLSNRNLSLSLGPSTDVFYYEHNPNLAVSGFDYINSFSTIISLGFRGDAIYPLSEKLRLESSLQFTFLSFGLRSVDSEENDQPGAKLLTPASGLNASFDLGMGYDLFNFLSMDLSYRFELTRITAWENILSSSNSAILGLYFRF